MYDRYMEVAVGKPKGGRGTGLEVSGGTGAVLADPRRERLLQRLRALADPSRLRIVEFLRNPSQLCCGREEGVCGCDFESWLGLAQPTVSHHLKVLGDAGLVRSERRGRWTYYELDEAALMAVSTELAALSGSTASQEETKCIRAS